VLDLLDHPAVQGGVAPLVVALIVAAVLARTRFAWLAIAAAYAAMVALSMGFEFTPMTIARKTVLIGLLAPWAGVAADILPGRTRAAVPALIAASALVSVWVFITVLQQRSGAGAYLAGAGIAVFVAALVALVLRLSSDGPRSGAAGLGLGLAIGVAGVVSASIGALIAGASLAAASGAMLLVQVVLGRGIAPGFTGTLPLGLLSALIAAGTCLLAELPWYALPLLLTIPLAALLPAPRHRPLLVRAGVLAVYALAAACLPIGAAWYAARGSLF
jgi:hypothetical protein